MAKLRARIDKDPRKFEKLIVPLDGQDEFVLDGTEYARKKEAPTPNDHLVQQKRLFHDPQPGKRPGALFPGAGGPSCLRVYFFDAAL